MRKAKLDDFSLFMHEVISYGNIPMRRCDVYKHACRQFEAGHGRKFDARYDGKFGPDYTAFSRPAIDTPDNEAWTLEEFERLEAGDMRIPERLQTA